MARQTWYPYAPDQAFGVGIAANEQLLDRLVALLDADKAAAPRAGSKAGVTQPVTPSPLLFAAWLGLVAGGDADGPVTTASALDAAPQMRRV